MGKPGFPIPLLEGCAPQTPPTGGGVRKLVSPHPTLAPRHAMVGVNLSDSYGAGISRRATSSFLFQSLMSTTFSTK